MSESTIEPGAHHGGWLRAPATWLGVAVAGLLAWLYQPLFFPASYQSLAIQSEEFFFEANEAAGAPVLVLSAWLFCRRAHYRDVLRGPGALAPGAALLALKEVMDEECAVISWSRGDLLLIDNGLVMHSRRPFQGARRILASIAQGLTLSS